MLQMAKLEGLRLPPGGNYRKTNDKAGMAELVASIKAKGVIQPILVRPVEGGHEIVAGFRRHAAATTAGLEEIPVMVKELTDEEALELQIVENSQREDPNPVDEAFGFKKLLDMGSHTPETLAAKLDRSTSYVLSRLRLLDISKKAQEKLKSGEISLGHALLLTRLKTKGEREALLKLITEDSGITVKAAIELLKEDFGRELEEAKFDTAGCADCPYLSGNQTLFPELHKTSRCMSTDCFMEKTRAHFKAWLDEKAGEGFKVLRTTDAVFELLPEYSNPAKGVCKILDPSSDGRDWRAETPKKYKSKCLKCTESHLYYAYEVDRYGRGPEFVCGEICIDLKCLAAMNGLGNSTTTSTSTSSGPSASQQQHAVNMRDRFLEEHLPGKVQASPVLQKRLLIYQLLRKFGGPSDNADFLKEFLPEVKAGFGYYEADQVYRFVSRFDEKRLDEAILALLLGTMPRTEHTALLFMTQEADVRFERDFSVDEDYLKTKTKAQLIELAGSLKLTISTTEKAKKGAIVSDILAQDLVGKVPEDIAKISTTALAQANKKGALK